MTRSRTAKLQKVGGKELPPISLDDIKSVKLKSIGDKRGIKVSDLILYLGSLLALNIIIIVVDFFRALFG